MRINTIKAGRGGGGGGGRPSRFSTSDCIWYTYTCMSTATRTSFVICMHVMCKHRETTKKRISLPLFQNFRGPAWTRPWRFTKNQKVVGSNSDLWRCTLSGHVSVYAACCESVFHPSFQPSFRMVLQLRSVPAQQVPTDMEISKCFCQLNKES